MPIKTEIGYLHPTKLRDFERFNEYMDLLVTQDFEFKEKLLSIYDNTEFISMIKGNHIFNTMNNIKILYPTDENIFNIWHSRYCELFDFMFKEDVFHMIKSPEEFEFYRDLILEINGVSFEKPNPNPEIQKPKDLWNMIQKMKGGFPSFEDKVSSVMLFYSGDILDLTLYQLNSLFTKTISYSNWIPYSIGSMFSEGNKLDLWFIHKAEKPQEIYLDPKHLTGETVMLDLEDEHLKHTENKE